MPVHAGFCACLSYKCRVPNTDQRESDYMCVYKCYFIDQTVMYQYTKDGDMSQDEFSAFSTAFSDLIENYTL